MKCVAGIAACLAVAVMFGCKKDDDNNNSTTISQMDSMFVRAAAMSNFAEISAGQIAVSRARDSSVALYGEMMVEDHTTANQQLKNIAASLRLYAPDSLDAQHIALRNSLMSLSGPQFDSVYINSQVMDHQLAITLFQNEANQGSHQNLRQYASELLPHLQMHFAFADSLAASLEND